MQKLDLSRFRNVSAAIALAVLAALLVLASCLTAPQRAYAVVNLGTVGVAVPSSVTIESGQSGRVSAACDPAYSDQYPNCLNDYCPSGCDFGKTGEGVACEDKTGQCTCYGYKSARYYPSCTVSSSNPSVVRASWSDGALSVTGYKAGTATLTVVPSLRLFSSASATIQVNVVEPAQEAVEPAGTPAAAESGSSASGSDGAAAAAAQAASETGSKSSATTAASKAESADSGKADVSADKAGAGTGATAVSVVAKSKDGTAGASGSTAQKAQSSATSSKSGAGSVVRVIEQADAGDSGKAAGDSAQTDEGTVSSEDVHRLDDGSVVAGSVLADVAGTGRVVTFWGGKEAESPDYMLIVAGANVPSDVDSKLQLSIEAEKGGQLQEQLGGIDYTAFTIKGAAKLPCTAQMFWRTTGAFENGDVVNVYQYDPTSGSFKKIHANLTLGEGYACFNLIDGGTYVITKKDDLDAAAAEADAEAATTAEADKAAKPATSGESAGAGKAASDSAKSGSDGAETASGPLQAAAPWAAPAGVAAIAVAAGVAAFAARRRSAARAALKAQADGGDSNE